VLFTRALGLAIAVHQILYVSRDGTEYLFKCFVPTLGVQLGPRSHCTAHILLTILSLAIVIAPGSRLLCCLCLTALTLVIASYSLRVSNHLILCWFLLLILCVDLRDKDFVESGAAGLVLLTYILAFFHKLNQEFFSVEHSCAAQMAQFFCWDRHICDVRTAKLLSLVAIWGTIVAEGIIPALLVVPATVVWGLLAALVFHFSLGLLGIVNFSAVMYAALLAFVPDSAVKIVASRVLQWGILPALLSSVAFVLIVWMVTPRSAGRNCRYRARGLAWGVQVLFGIVTALAVLGIAACLRLPNVHLGLRAPFPHFAVLICIWAAFLANGLSPYLGLKTEFSFAMFSNLRCDPWRHLLVRDAWRPFRGWHYVEVERIEGLPQSEQVTEDPGALLALHVLSQSTTYRYSAYFFRKSLERLLSADPKARINVCYSDESGRYELDTQDPSALSRLRRGPQMNLFPFVLPMDPDAPHTEQGSVVKGTGQRQLF
jgi:hypothetical protein